MNVKRPTMKGLGIIAILAILLILLSVNALADGGCTLTAGYWKTHSIYGPARLRD